MPTLTLRKRYTKARYESLAVRTRVPGIDSGMHVKKRGLGLILKLGQGSRETLVVLNAAVGKVWYTWGVSVLLEEHAIMFTCRTKRDRVVQRSTA